MNVSMGMEEYAKHRGCSTVAVWKAISSGRIAAKMVQKPGKKKPEYVIDPIVADGQWVQNTKKTKSSKVISENVATKRGAPTPEQSVAIKAVKDAKKAEKQQKAQKRLQEREESGEVPTHGDIKRAGIGANFGAGNANSSGSEGLSVHQRRFLADAIKAEALATNAQIDLAVKQKSLVYAEDIEDVISEKIAMTRDSMMHIPKSFKVQFKDAPAEYSAWLEDYIKAALQNLAGITTIEERDGK